MIKSKFTFKAYLVIFLLVLLVVVGIVTLLYVNPKTINDLFQLEIATVLVVAFLFIALLFNELRTKIILVEIRNDFIEKRNYMQHSKTFRFKDFDSFATSKLSSETDTFEYLYLIRANKKIIKISETYHSNYSELKQAIAKHVKCNGEVEFSFLDEIKDAFW
ncbi:MAG: hypothetical protein J0M08_11800 [Bacteroidetes bacterium]|nr:hypothetical protein [Bacteroidota bacterium]